MKRLAPLAMASLLLAFFASAQAGADIRWGVTISGGTTPPPVRYEPPPPPRNGYVWVEGYWNWNGSAFVWVPGHWLLARAGYEYAQPHCPPGQRKKGNC